jgi:hypothetical protein
MLGVAFPLCFLNSVELGQGKGNPGLEMGLMLAHVAFCDRQMHVRRMRGLEIE